MFRTICLLLVSACLAFCLAFAASAGTKRAFIVGVGRYDELTDLQKTTGDATGYASVFENDLGFEVTPLIDPDTDRFLESFEAFLQSIEPGDQVAFIFSGHGWSDGGKNYLALADAPLHTSLLSLRKRTISLSEEVLDEIRARNPEMVFAVVDACRDNPFDTGTRSMTKGMAPARIRSDTLIVYAAGEYEMALDRLGPDDAAPYSVFTRSLLPKLRDPDMPLTFAVGEARAEVIALAASVAHTQKPAVYSDVDYKFCFSGQCRLGDLDRETRDWLAISEATDPDLCAQYSRYLETYPDGKFVDRAKRSLASAPCAGARLRFRQVAWYANLAGHSDEVYGLDYSPSGRFLASASADKTARLWVVGMGPNTFGQFTEFVGHTEPLLSVRFSPDEEYLVTASMDDTARIWRATGGEAVRVLRGHTGDVAYADFSPDGKRVATASYDNTVRIWEAATGAELMKITGHTAAVRSVRYSPDGTLLLTASNDGTVRLWDAATGEPVRTVESGAVPASYAEFSADGEKILVSSLDRTAHVWSGSGDMVKLSGHDAALWNAAFDPDGEMVATSADDLSGRLWDGVTGAVLARIQDLGTQGANWVCFSPDGKMIAVAMRKGNPQLWEVTYE